MSSSSARSGRPTVPLSQAAKILGRDWRTVKKLVENGELDGGSTLVNKRRTYYVYADQLGPSHPGATAGDHDRQLLDTISELQRELEQSRVAEASAREAQARSQAAAASAEETNRLLQANQAILLSAVREFQGASDDAAGVVDDYRALTDRHWSIADRYRKSASNFAQAADNYQDILGRLLTPDDIRALTTDDRSGQ